MSDAEQLIKARDYAIVKQDPLQAGYRFYTEGELTASTQEYVAAYVKAKSRITGTIRYYGPVISLNGPDKATFAFCQDQGKGYDLHLQTNKINKTPVTKNSYVLYNSALRKNDKGVWVTTALNSDRGVQSASLERLVRRVGGNSGPWPAVPQRRPSSGRL